MSLKDVHPLNALTPIVATPDGIVIVVKLVLLQPENAVLPIVVNPVEGKVTEVSPVQPEKALVPIPTTFNLLNVISEVTSKNIFCGIEILVPLPVICIFPLVLLNASLLTVIVLFEIVMLLKDVHPLNALSPIVVTLDGIEIAVKLVFLQPLKAKLPIVVNPVEGKVTEVSPVQPEKALVPIVVNPVVGKVTEVSPVQPEKALVPIPTIFNLLNVISEVTPKNIFCGIEILVPLPVICIFPLVLLNASLLTVIVLFEIVMLLRDVHPLNALTPIVATLDGIVIVVKLVLLQPLKAKLPIVVSVDRVVIIWFVVVDCKLVQS